MTCVISHSHLNYMLGSDINTWASILLTFPHYSVCVCHVQGHVQGHMVLLVPTTVERTVDSMSFL